MEESVLDIKDAAGGGAAALLDRPEEDGAALRVGAVETEPVPQDVVVAVEDAGVGRRGGRWSEGELKAAFSARVLVVRTGGVGIELRTLFAVFVAIVINAACLVGIYYSSMYEWRWLSGGGGGGDNSGVAVGTTGNGGVLMVGEGGLSGDVASVGTGGSEIRPFVPTLDSTPHADLPAEKTTEPDMAEASAKLLGDTPVIAFSGATSPQPWTVPKVVRPAPKGPVIEAPTPQTRPASVGPVVVGPKEHVTGTPGNAVASIGTGGAHGKGHANLGGDEAGSGDEGEPVYELMKPGVGGNGGGKGHGTNRGPSGANSDQPVPLDMPAPVIPLELQAIAYKARVTFIIQVLSNGRVGTITLDLKKSSGSSAELNAVYRATVAKFKFLAPTRAGQRVEGVFVYTYIGQGAPEPDAVSGGGGGGDGG